MTQPAQEPTGSRVLLSVEEAAQRLNVGRTTVYALIKAGDLVTVKVGRRRLVPAEAVDAYIAALTNQRQEPDGCGMPATGCGNATTPATARTATAF